MGNERGGGSLSICTPFELQQEYQNNSTALGTFCYVRKLHIIVLVLSSHKVTSLYWEIKI